MPGIQLTATPAMSQAGNLNENSEKVAKRTSVVMQEKHGFFDLQSSRHYFFVIP